MCKLCTVKNNPRVRSIVIVIILFFTVWDPNTNHILYVTMNIDLSGWTNTQIYNN